MVAIAAVGVCLFNSNTTAAHSLTDSTPSQCVRFHSASSRTPMPIMPFTSIKALRLHTPTSSKVFSLLQETTIQEEEEQKNTGDPDSKQEGSQNPNSLEPTTKLFVGNLPFGCDEAEVRTMFEECGKVIDVEIAMNNKTGRRKGYAFVQMGTVEEARVAIQRYDEYELGGRVVNVRFADSTGYFPDRRSSDPDLAKYVESPYRIYCGNLAWAVTSRSLRIFFDKNGNVLGAKVMYDRRGRSLGYGFVSFASKDDVKDALDAHNGKDLEGRPMQLSRSRTTQKRAIKKNSAIEEKSISLENSATEETSISQEIVKE